MEICFNVDVSIVHICDTNSVGGSDIPSVTIPNRIQGIPCGRFLFCCVGISELLSAPLTIAALGIVETVGIIYSFLEDGCQKIIPNFKILDKKTIHYIAI